MYNDSQKKRYLEYSRSHYSEEYVINLTSLFKKTEQFEEMFGKDVSLFSREDISNMYAFIRYSDQYTYSNTNSRLSAYCSWCVDNLLVPDGCNHFKEFVFEDFARYINKRLERKKYITREELYDFIKNMDNPRDKFIFLCLFEFGKSENFSDILLMKIEDIDSKANQVRLNSGKVVHISNDLISIAYDANEEDKYYFPISGQTRSYNPSPYIVKTVNTRGSNSLLTDDLEARGIKFIARVIASNIQLLDEYKGINAASLEVSGQIEMINKRSRELGISVRDYIANNFDELRAQYNLTPDIPNVYYNKYKAYL